MKEKLKETTDYFASLYPDIEFSVSRNQTELLDYTISNLQQNLSLGFLFIFIVAVLFLVNLRHTLFFHYIKKKHTQWKGCQRAGHTKLFMWVCRIIY